MVSITTVSTARVTPGTTSTTVSTARVSSTNFDSSATLVFDDAFDESGTTDLALHVPDTGDYWSEALGAGAQVVGGASYVECIGEHHGDAGSTTVAADGSVRWNISPFASSDFPSTDFTCDIIAQFTGGDATAAGGPIIFWGVGGGKQSTVDVDNGWVFFWTAQTGQWALLQQESSSQVNATQAWPGDGTYMKMEMRSTGAVGYYSTDGTDYNAVISLDSTWDTTAGIHAQLYYGNFTDQADPAFCQHFSVYTT